MSLISTSQIEAGSIIRYAIGTGGSVYRGIGATHTTGYVDDIQYRSQDGDEIDHFETYEIISINKENQQILRDYKWLKLDVEAITQGGLAPNQEWALILEPRRVRPDMQSLGQNHEGIVEKRGDISDLAFQDKVRERISNMGGADGIRYATGDHTGYATPRNSAWGLYAPVGLTRWNAEDDFEPKVIKPGARRIRKATIYQERGIGKLGANEGTVLDLPLIFAEKAIGLKGTLVTAFATPSTRGLRPLVTVRQLWELAKDQNSELEKYLSAGEIPENWSLQDAENELDNDGNRILSLEYGDPDVISYLLSQPKKPNATKPITLFSEALEIAKNNPDHFMQFQGVGKAIAPDIANAIIEAHQKKTEALGTHSKDTENARKEILAAWGTLAADHLTLQGVTTYQQEVENAQRYIHTGDDITIDFVKAQGKRPSFSIVYKPGSGTITMLPQNVFKTLQAHAPQR